MLHSGTALGKSKKTVYVRTHAALCLQDASGAYWASSSNLTVAGDYAVSCLLGSSTLASSTGSGSFSLLPGVIDAATTL